MAVDRMFRDTDSLGTTGGGFDAKNFSGGVRLHPLSLIPILGIPTAIALAIGFAPEKNLPIDPDFFAIPVGIVVFFVMCFLASQALRSARSNSDNY